MRRPSLTIRAGWGEGAIGSGVMDRMSRGVVYMDVSVAILSAVYWAKDSRTEGVGSDVCVSGPSDKGRR
jgi:hypothetical protein